MSIHLPTCPTDCSTLLPQLSFNDCAPDFAMGEISKIYITTVDAGGLSDVTSLAEWNTRLSNTSANADAIRFFNVVGSKPVPESTEIEFSLKRKVQSTKQHTINIKVDETSALNHDFLRQLECGGLYLIWYANDKYIWGGDDGISVSFKLDENIPESNQELYVFEGTATWESKFSPERDLNPFV